MAVPDPQPPEQGRVKKQKLPKKIWKSSKWSFTE
jgi:hypothetical protein